MTYAIQQIVNGLSVGGEYALLALGLAIVFSVMGLVNFAHGDLIMIGGYAMVAAASAGIPIELLPIVGIGSGVLGAILMERIAFRPVRGAPVITMLLTSFGLSIVIEQGYALAFGSQPRPVPSPGWLNGHVSVGGITLPLIQLVEVGVTTCSLLLLVLMLRRTVIGLSMRAALTDFPMVRLMGIRGDYVVLVAFALSGFFAGVAGVLILARAGTVGPYIGFTPVLKAFIATVLGGFGSLAGAVVGGYVLGFSEVIMQVVLPSNVSNFSTIFVLLGVVVIMVARPQGIMGKPARSRVA